MALKSVFQDILNRVQYETSIDYVRVWNDQLSLSEQQKIYSFPNLACFVEIVLTKSGASLGIVGGDVTIRFHIVSVQLDAMDGTYEQNLEVYDYRDQIIDVFTYYEPIHCSGMQLINEQPDYAHTNVYHYVVDFVCSYIDETGYVDKDKILKDPPTDLNVTGSIQ